MSDKPNLPVLPGLLGLLNSGPPTLDEARKNLGGAWEGGPDVGRTVSVAGAHGARIGVVVHSSPTHRDVWIGGGRLQRVPVARVELGADDANLADVAADARIFGALQVGQRVAYEARDGTVGEGTLVEKLRFGGLVGLEDEGRVLAVSFRKLTPASEGEPS